jgi:hypothetical protein
MSISAYRAVQESMRHHDEIEKLLVYPQRGDELLRKN